ncbi:hypothetical protein M407DRAFT_8850 [Tulasnella calospora MUT 4182]|uniref:Importin N-terminal domain-containing protein n=1 Tax=Tulasnella calospora MUT 4182 TaxID=1051891 RepID=A0A0C3QGK5_9AGAM|nr:hypothetical protein M407DRAFT_8850 [Tulasnella calospora MUT 4182]
MDPSYVTNLHALLAQTVASSDTALLKNATATLNQQYYKDPACIPALFEIIATSPEQNIRQLAAVELRKRIAQGDGKLWRALDANIRQQVKTKIVETILAEQVAIVRHSTSRVIAAIASWDLAANAWPELMPFLQQATSSPTAAHREVGIYIMYSVLETVIEGIKQQISSLFTIFAELIKDPESAQVRITTVQALGVLAQYIEPEDKQYIKTFQGLVPQILAVVNETCAANNEPAARDGFDVVETLLILRSNTDRASATGTLGEVITGMKGGITAFTEPVLKITTSLLADADPEVRSNAAFATGVLIENSDTDVSPHYGEILQRLSTLFSVQSDSSQSEKHGRDNAAGAVSRMIIKNSAVIPLDQVLPVLYGALPLQNDFLENAPVYRAIFHLFRTSPPVMMNYLNVLLPAFATVLSPDTPDQLTPDVRAELVELIRHLQQQVPDQIAAAGLAGVA